MKYIIELEQIENTNLYKAKGFNTLVFDQTGIDKLTPYNETPELKMEIVKSSLLKVGDLVKTPHGSVIYKVLNSCDDGFNVINMANNHYNFLKCDYFICVGHEDAI